MTDGLTCCLPCPLTDWVFADDFEKQIPAANYVAIVSLICTTLLLLTFAVLPEEKSHRHYLSVGVTVSLLLLSLAFIIPLGTKPDYCYNDITFDDMHTDVGCAWTGALLLAGAMGTVVWSKFLPSSRCIPAMADHAAKTQQSLFVRSGQRFASSSTSSAPKSSNGSPSPSASAFQPSS